MNKKLSHQEQVEMVKAIFSLMKLLHDEEALAGVVLTNSAYDGFKRIIGEAAIPYDPADLQIDPAMEHTFVAAGLLIMRGTQLQ